jgi:septal ring factor EnvC (AmiA/AmiB activator)
MARSKQSFSTHEETLEELLDIVANAREELVAVERRLEKLRADIARSEKRKNGGGTKS